jgi:isoleucyl-tRNA synthetase
VPANSLDGWALAELDQLIVDVTAAYDAYQLHRAFRLLHDFCAVQISSLYGNAMKDRLYCEAVDAPIRRRCQTVMQKMAVALTKLLAPMLVFTADEAWEHLKQPDASVHLALLPVAAGAPIDADWKLLMSLRDDALAQLDKLKKEAGMNKALDAELVYTIPDAALAKRLAAFGADLEDIVGAGCHSITSGGEKPSVTVIDRRKDYTTCARSWKRRPDVGSDAEYPELSARDAAVMRSLSR